MTWLSIIFALCLLSMWIQPSYAHSCKLENIRNKIENTTFADFSLCAEFKRLLGLEYDQYNKNDVDLSKLTLNYITPEVTIKYQLIKLTELPKTPHFNPNKGIIIYMHGFIEDPSWGSYKGLDKAFLREGNFNILALDASSLIRFFYLRASTMVQFIGEALGTALVHMMDAGLKHKAIHLLGHSLGSHIAGFTGKTVLAMTGRRVGRISGLDPAGPCFHDVNSEHRLNSMDADFVDVMHTNGGIYGLNEQIGDVDFYPNNGLKQPDCITQVCSHNRAWVYYAESVLDPKGFPAVRCNSWDDFKNGNCHYNDVQYMGYGNNQGGPTGRYYLKTAGSYPYALGDRGINDTSLGWHLQINAF